MKIKKMLVLACVMVICGCISLPKTNCVVVKKLYNAGWVEHTMVNEDGVWMETDINHLDKYFVTVKGNASNGKVVTWTYTVNSNQYYSVEIGKAWPYNL